MKVSVSSVVLAVLVLAVTCGQSSASRALPHRRVARMANPYPQGDVAGDVANAEGIATNVEDALSSTTTTTAAPTTASAPTTTTAAPTTAASATTTTTSTTSAPTTSYSYSG